MSIKSVTFRGNRMNNQPLSGRAQGLPIRPVEDGVVTFNSNGVIEGVSPGVVTYHAFAHNGLEASCTITVVAE